MNPPEDRIKTVSALHFYAAAFMIVIFLVAVADLILSLTPVGGFIGQPFVYIMVLFAVLPFLMIAGELKRISERIDALEKKPDGSEKGSGPAPPESA
jgi:predicted tellurium resistance membrane protein TerC